MTEKDIIKQGIAEAEKEAQQKEINKVKQIVKSYLEKIQDKRKIEDKAREERKMLEKDLDDLKSGRLDKILERQESDPRAKEVSIIVVTKVEKEYIPMYPWRSPWYVEMKNTPYLYCDAGPWINTITTPTVYSLGQTTCSDTSGQSTSMLGTVFSNFSGGSYNIDGDIINL